MSIRSTSKAIIINKGKVLLNKCYDEKNGEYYSLPGGGQNQYETMEDAIKRECREETGYCVRVLRFCALCEEICEDPLMRENRPDYAHKMYHIFLCELESENREAPTETDNMQIASEWIDINSLSEIKIMPNSLAKNINKFIEKKIPMFLGSEIIQFNHG